MTEQNRVFPTNAQYRLQHLPIVGGQAMACELLDPCLAFFTAERNLFWALHGGRHLYDV